MVRKAAIDAIRKDPDFSGGLYAAGARLRGHKAAVRLMALRMSSVPLRWYEEAPTRAEAEAMLVRNFRFFSPHLASVRSSRAR